MKMRTRHGFTIIETVLFLGVTGLMIATMFIGIGSSVGAQRYRDSVESFKSLLQQQYADLGSVQNSREGRWVCAVSGNNLTAISDTTGTASATPRGQASCDIVGRYVAIEGGDVRVYTVLAQKRSSPSLTADTDISKLAANYVLGVTTDSTVETSQLEWGARIAWPTGSNPLDAGSGDRKIGLLFIRSPDSGGTYTFSTDDVASAAPTGEKLIATVVEGDSVPGRKQRLLCIDPDGMVLTPAKGIFIDARAADSSAVRVDKSGDFNEAQAC